MCCVCNLLCKLISFIFSVLILVGVIVLILWLVGVIPGDDTNATTPSSVQFPSAGEYKYSRIASFS